MTSSGPPNDRHADVAARGHDKLEAARRRRAEQAAATPSREEFLGRLRDALVQAINGNNITIADAWDILREWDRAMGTRGDIPNFPTREEPS